MRFAHENLEIWQLGMKLVDLIYSLKERFPVEDKFGLWDQLVRACEAIPRDIAEGYAKTSKKERALYMERAKSETAEVDTSFKEAVKKRRIAGQEYKELIEPLIKELYFKIIGYRKWLLRISSKRNDPPLLPSVAIHHFRHGFTLIELLVAVSVFAIVGGTASIILSTTLQSASKSEILREVKQNGDYAISIMERMIRNAQNVEGVDGDCLNHLNSCSVGGTSGNCLKIKNPDGDFTTFSLLGPKIASSGGMLTNDKVSASILNFTCTKPAGKPPVVTVSFTLTQAEVAARAAEAASVAFRTTISLRTY